jgi:hypothetical protein
MRCEPARPTVPSRPPPHSQKRPAMFKTTKRTLAISTVWSPAGDGGGREWSDLAATIAIAGIAPASGARRRANIWGSGLCGIEEFRAVVPAASRFGGVGRFRAT